MPAVQSQVELLIFISYRREDSSGHAGRLNDALLQRFDHRQLFMDVDAIPPGVDFGDHIQAAVARCDVLLALIGPRWLSLKNDSGERRLDDGNDFVRLEIDAALKRNVRVIPVLIQGARMPPADELPDPIRTLARRNAFELSDARFRFDAERLIDVLTEMENAKRPTVPVPTGPAQPQGAGPTRSRPRRRRARWQGTGLSSIIALIAIAAVVGLTALSGILSPPSSGPTPTITPTPTGTATVRVTPSATISRPPSPDPAIWARSVPLDLATCSVLEAGADEIDPKGNVGSIRCPIAAGPVSDVRFSRFPSKESLESWWGSRLDAKGIVAGAAPSRGCYSENGKQFAGDNPYSEGSVLCSRESKSSPWQLEWMDLDTLVYGVAIGSQPSPVKELADWWLELTKKQAESALIAAATAATDSLKGCMPYRILTRGAYPVLNAVAAIDCDVVAGSGLIDIQYFKMPNPTALDGEFRARLKAATKDIACSSGLELEYHWHAGVVACHRTGGFTRLNWTDRDHLVFGALRGANDAKPPDLFDWWMRNVAGG